MIEKKKRGRPKKSDNAKLKLVLEKLIYAFRQYAIMGVDEQETHETLKEASNILTEC